MVYKWSNKKMSKIANMLNMLQILKDRERSKRKAVCHYERSYSKQKQGKNNI